MFRILRKIRQKLLQTGSFKRYFLYGIGEIILIVIGVLLALELNNWNNFRFNRFQEKQILVRLSEELGQSMQRISFMRKGVQRKERALEAIAPYLQGEPVTEKAQFLNNVLLAASLGWEQPKLEHITFDEIVSSGKLSLIRDTQLRLGLIRFFHTVEQREQRSIVRITEFPNITYKLLPRGNKETTLKEDLSEEQMEEMVNSVLASDLKEFLIPERNRARFMLSIWDEMEEQATELQEQIMQVKGIKVFINEREARFPTSELMDRRRIDGSVTQ